MIADTTSDIHPHSHPVTSNRRDRHKRRQNILHT